jgi:thiamine-phosphate pyrophosphorylase
MKPILCLVTDRSAASGDLVEWVAAAVGAGVDWVQIRERELDGAALLEHAEAIAIGARLAAAERGSEVTIFVNRRVDVALALDAGGVQLGFDSVDATTARQLLGPDAQIGISLHHPDEINQMNPAANHVQLAPIFQPLSKSSSRPPLGIEAISAATRFEIPVIAQGGITPTHAAAVIEAGAVGIAVTGAILSATDPIPATQSLRTALDSASR